MTTLLLVVILIIVIINHIAVRALQVQINKLSESEDIGEDSLYEEAKRIVIENGKCATSLIQRWMKVGYSRAARLVDMLEENGVVSAADGSAPREVLVKHD